MLTQTSGLYRVKSSKPSLPNPADPTLTLFCLSGNQYITSKYTLLNSIGRNSLLPQIQNSYHGRQH